MLARETQLIAEDLVVKKQRQCTLCGDQVGERKCQLHPGICNICEREYCECQVENRVELDPLEDISRLPEADRVNPLRARKVTLKLAGKLTSPMAPISMKLGEAQKMELVWTRRTSGDDDDQDPRVENMRAILEGD